MKRTRVELPLGTCFLVPLRSGGYARGVLVRNSRKGGVMFGCFFGPKLLSPCDISRFEGLQPGDAVLQGKFGDLGFRRNVWEVLGILPGWRIDEWKMPPFVSETDDTALIALTTYDDDTLSSATMEVALRDDPKVRNLPEDSVMGYGFVEIRLSLLLSEGTEAGSRKRGEP